MNSIQRLLGIDELMELGHDTRSLVLQLLKLTRKLQMDMQQAVAELQALKAQNDRARAEVLAKIAALEATIANGVQTTPAFDAALADLKGSVQTDDDIVPDVVPDPVP